MLCCRGEMTRGIQRHAQICDCALGAVVVNNGLLSRGERGRSCPKDSKSRKERSSNASLAVSACGWSRVNHSYVTLVLPQCYLLS